MTFWHCAQRQMFAPAHVQMSTHLFIYNTCTPGPKIAVNRLQNVNQYRANGASSINKNCTPSVWWPSCDMIFLIHTLEILENYLKLLGCFLEVKTLFYFSVFKFGRMWIEENGYFTVQISTSLVSYHLCSCQSILLNTNWFSQWKCNWKPLMGKSITICMNSCGHSFRALLIIPWKWIIVINFLTN